MQAQVASSVSSTLYTNFQFLVEPGRTLVLRNYRQADTPQFVRNVPDLIKAVKYYLENHNQNPHVFVCNTPVEHILVKIAKCKEALDALQQKHTKK